MRSKLRGGGGKGDEKKSAKKRPSRKDEQKAKLLHPEISDRFVADTQEGGDKDSMSSREKTEKTKKSIACFR